MSIQDKIEALERELATAQPVANEAWQRYRAAEAGIEPVKTEWLDACHRVRKLEQALELVREMAQGEGDAKEVAS